MLMLSEFLRRFIETSNCEFLYDCNQYFTKRFFELALSNEDYIKSIKNSDTKLNRDRFSVYHCNIIQCACIVALQDQSLEIEIFKELYKVYVIFKKKSLYFTGKNEWHEFTITILSHMIWSRQYEIFLWVYEHQIYVLQLIESMDVRFVERARKHWYKSRWNELHIYLLRFSILSDRLDMCQKLIDSNIFKVDNYSRKVVAQIGYKFDAESVLVTSEFADTPEWFWMNKYTENLDEVDVVKCINVFIESGFDKSRIVDLFRMQDDPTVFWNYFLNMSDRHLKFITATKICSIISDPKFIVSIDDLKEKIVNKMFQFSNIIKKTMVFYICDCINDYKIEFIDGFEKTIQIYNNNTTTAHCMSNSHRDILTKICKLCVKKNFNNSENLIEKVRINCTDKIFFLHSCFGESANRAIDFRNHSVVPIEEDVDCAICLCDMTQNFIHLPCGHKFHKSCVQMDFTSRFSSDFYLCPLCRVKVHQTCLWDHCRLL